MCRLMNDMGLPDPAFNTKGMFSITFSRMESENDGVESKSDGVELKNEGVEMENVGMKKMIESEWPTQITIDSAAISKFVGQFKNTQGSGKE